MNQRQRDENIIQFEVEMRTTLAKLSVQQEEISKSIHEYIEKTVHQEVMMSKTRSEIDTLFHENKELKQELKETRKEISEALDDKINSLYKITSITAFIVSTIVAIIGIAVTAGMP